MGARNQRRRTAGNTLRGMPSGSRHVDDPAPPTRGEVVRDVALRAVLPSVGLLVANVALGRALAGSAALQEREVATIRRLQSRQGTLAAGLARAISTVSDVPASIAQGVFAVAMIQKQTHRSSLAAIPAIALLLETGVYVAAGSLVGRPRPDVPRLHRDQPTSSFPSGHQGACVALMVVAWLFANEARSPLLRAAIRGGCLGYPAAVAWSRVRVGMHYPSDVVVGTANGLAAGLLAWHSLRRTGAAPRAVQTLRPRQAVKPGRSWRSLCEWGTRDGRIPGGGPR